MNDTTPRPNWAPTEIDSEAASLISDIAKEFATTNTQEAIDKIPGEITESEPKLEAPKEPEVEEPKPIQEGLDRLVAREVEIRTREDNVKARESHYAQLESRLKEMEAKQIPTDFLNHLESKPTATLKAMGISAEDLARMIIAEKMQADGKAPPPELLKRIEDHKRDSEIRELRKTIESQNQASAARAYYDQVSNEALSYIKGESFGKDVPLLDGLAKAGNHQRIHEEIMGVMREHAQANMQRDPNGKLLPYSEAAKIVEKKWTEYQKLLGVKTDPKASTVTLKTNVSAGTAVKPPDKPLAPWLQRGNIMEDGVKAGLMEFRRLEQTQK